MYDTPEKIITALEKISQAREPRIAHIYKVCKAAAELFRRANLTVVNIKTVDELLVNPGVYIVRDFLSPWTTDCINVTGRKIYRMSGDKRYAGEVNPDDILDEFRIKYGPLS